MHGNARFEVLDMDGNRIDKVAIIIENRHPGPRDPASA
jgi:CBS domain containing-hemolysin-like protein